jgi:hypothetical protein
MPTDKLERRNATNALTTVQRVYIYLLKKVLGNPGLDISVREWNQSGSVKAAK